MSVYRYSTYWPELHARHRGELAAVGYRRFGEGFNRASYRLRRGAVLRLSGRHPELFPERLLEAAVGVGAYAEVWQRLGVRQWHGLDLSPEAVDYCRERYPQGKFFVQDLAAESWALPEASRPGYDLVTAIDVLYHLVDDAGFETALRNLARCVRPGGFLLVSDVFAPGSAQIAPHVKRRSLACYRRILDQRMTLLDREPVFAILGDPYPRPGRLPDLLLSLFWKGLSQALLHTPGRWRDAAGAGMVYLFWPLDAALRRLGVSAGTNLELALFRKS